MDAAGPYSTTVHTSTQLILGATLAAFVTACGDEADPAGSAAVEVRFAALADGRPLACGDDYDGLGDGTFEYRGLRFFVSDVALGSGADRASLELEDDGQWQDGQVALLDFEDGASECALGTGETRAVVRGRLDRAATSDGLSFTVGVPFDVNHQDVALATGPLSLTSMFWNWQGGYKFMRLDGFAGGEAYNVHLGSTGCDGGPTGGVTTCMNPNRVEVVLDDWADGDVVLLDLAALLDGATLTNTEMTPPGCMSAPGDPECGPVFENLGLAYGANGPGAQAAFSVMEPDAVP
jgi:uncharacterized repeat protein (TIGR04052 family)